MAPNVAGYGKVKGIRMMKYKKGIALALATMLTLSVLAGCGGSDSGSSTDTGSSDTSSRSNDTSSSNDTATTTDDSGGGGGGAPAEGPDTNNGRPYNLTKVAYDSRQDKYLNGINATILPIVDELVEITVWLPWSSTALTDLNDSEVFKELERRTNVRINWMHPPEGQSADNFNLLIASDNLPHFFSNAESYPGGEAKAVSDGVYLDLTPYYDMGWMPNIKYIRENNPDINRDMIDDDGRMLSLPLLDIVPSSPWSGMWVRQDWLDELGLSAPVTIEDWDEMLYAMQAKTPHPLYVNLPDWFGMFYSYVIAGGYESHWDYIRRDGTTVEYGPINEGWRAFLTKMNQWYADGILDPDFATRTYDDVMANTINGQYGAFSNYYGAIGHLNMAGPEVDPNFKVAPTLQPTTYAGQTTHLRLFDSTVRGNKGFVTSQAEDDGVLEILIRYMDYLYSQDGGDLCSYGPEGVSYVWTDEGVIEWVYPDLINDPDADFWSLFPRFKLHGEPAYLRDSTAYDNEQEVWDSIDLWGSQSADWVMPDNISHTPEEAAELAGIEADINTYREEMAYRFITGQVPLSDFDNYVAQMKNMGIDRAVEIKQAALDRYLNR